ncbi:MAG: L-rhamnose mutarotase [Chitinophagaceae bacterium]|nr:L-rhamnose mutarotase [Chitinophagaceae bacterium]
MAKVAFQMQLFKGFEDEYKRRHDELWPDLHVLLKETGVSDYSIFLNSDTNALFGVLTIEEPAKLDELPAHPVMQKWWAYMSDIMETNPDHSPVSIPLENVFYLP